MRQRAEWMMPVDDKIMEYLQSEGTSTPSRIGEGIGNDSNYVTQRCSELTNRGLLQRIARGVYQLTDQGQAYLEGDLDASTLTSDADTNSDS